MTMLTIDQLSYLLKYALQKIKQPGVRSTLCPCLSVWFLFILFFYLYSYIFFFILFGTSEQTEPFQKPVSLEQHPDYAEYIFHPMDLCTLEKV